MRTTPINFGLIARSGNTLKNKDDSKKADSPTHRVGESLWCVGESIFEIFIIYHFQNFKQLNQLFIAEIILGANQIVLL
jgi:hypothetical protein